MKDATAAAVTPELGDGYASALTNFGFLANEVLTTDEAVQTMTVPAPGRRPLPSLVEDYPATLRSLRQIPLMYAVR